MRYGPLLPQESARSERALYRFTVVLSWALGLKRAVPHEQI